VTLVEVVWSLGIILGIILVSKILGAWLGMSSMIVGMWLTCLAAALVLAGYVYQRRRSVPKCENGICGIDDYEWTGFAKDLGVADYGDVRKCRCGRRYLWTSDKFSIITDDGRLKPYKLRVKRHWFYTWVDDK